MTQAGVAEVPAAGTVTGADVLVDCLVRAGVSTLFGVPGDTSVAFYDALYRRSDEIRHVLARDERHAVFMADAYARLTRRVGVVEVSSGGGSTYAVGGMGEAYTSSVPILLIASDIPVTSRDTGALTEMDQAALFSAVTKWHGEAESAAAVSGLIARALTHAVSGRPAPVVVIVPENVLDEELLPDRCESDLTGDFRAPFERQAAEPAAVRRAAALLATARRPAVVAGSGVHWSDATSALDALVERAGLPTATTIHGCGTISDRSPWYLGLTGGNGGTDRAIAYLRTADVVLLVGTRANATDTDGWTAPPRNGPQVIHVDIDPSRAGRNFPGSIALVGDADVTLRALASAMPPVAGGRRVELADWISHNAPQAGAPADEDRVQDRLSAADVVRVLHEVVAERPHVVIADPGTPTPHVAGLWPTPAPGRSVVIPRGHGPMGYAIPASVGAALARPGAAVVAVTADGGFAMCCGELETVVRLGLPNIYVQLTNNSLGWIKMLQHLYMGKRYFGVDPGPIDAVLVARGCGMEAARVQSLSALRAAVTAAVEGGYPVYIDVPVRHLIDDIPPVSSWHAAVRGNALRPSY
jgi:acetolactate synthase I/II/III large subunit